MLFMSILLLQELTHERGKGGGSPEPSSVELHEGRAGLHPGADVEHTGADALASSHYGTVLPPAQSQAWRCLSRDGVVLQTHCQHHRLSQARQELEPPVQGTAGDVTGSPGPAWGRLVTLGK